MKYDQTKPCKTCPFLRKTKFGFSYERAFEIVHADGGFACHKTTTEKGHYILSTKAAKAP